MIWGEREQRKEEKQGDGQEAGEECSQSWGRRTSSTMRTRNTQCGFALNVNIGPLTTDRVVKVPELLQGLETGGEECIRQMLFL